MPEFFPSWSFLIQALDRAGHTPGYSITGRPAADLVIVVYPDPTRPDPTSSGHKKRATRRSPRLGEVTPSLSGKPDRLRLSIE